MVLTGLKCSERAGIIVYMVGCNFVAVNNVALLLSDTTKLALALALALATAMAMAMAHGAVARLGLGLAWLCRHRFSLA